MPHTGANNKAYARNAAMICAPRLTIARNAARCPRKME